MKREFPTSIYAGMPRANVRPTYNRATLLHIVRGEKKLRAQKAKSRFINLMMSQDDGRRYASH